MWSPLLVGHSSCICVRLFDYLCLVSLCHAFALSSFRLPEMTTYDFDRKCLCLQLQFFAPSSLRQARGRKSEGVAQGHQTEAIEVLNEETHTIEIVCGHFPSTVLNALIILIVFVNPWPLDGHARLKFSVSSAGLVFRKTPAKNSRKYLKANIIKSG